MTRQVKLFQLFFNNTRVFKENFDERNIMLVISQCIYTLLMNVQFMPKNKEVLNSLGMILHNSLIECNYMYV